MKRILFIVVSALLMVASTASLEVHSSDRKSKSFPVPGVLAAAAVAYQDFESKLTSRKAGSSHLERHINNINNYYIKAHIADDSFVVEFVPMPLNGSSLRGGGVKYVVSPKSGEIIDYLEYR